jgi:hypothetical protein
MTTPIDALKDRFYGATTSAPSYTANGLRDILASGVHAVEYRKKDGTVTVMELTLDPGSLPPGDPNKPVATHSPHLLHAYSVDRAGWRSVILENVISVRPL